MRSPAPSPAADPEVAATVRLLHRRRNWIWTTAIAVVAWLVACGLLGALAPNANGAGLGIAAVLILLLTAVGVIALVASVVDTVRLHRVDPAVRRQAAPRTAHYPVRAHAYSYPPRHRFSWVFSWIMLTVVLGIGVAAVPGLVDGVAYLAGAESSSTFTPLSYGQECGRGGCSTVTYGTLANGTSVTWPDDVPLEQPFTVRQPLWNWGFGSQMIDGDGSAIGTIIVGLLFDSFAVLILVHLVKLARRWLRHRQLGAQMANVTRLPRRAGLDPAADLGQLGRAARVAAFAVIDDRGDQSVPARGPGERRLALAAGDLGADHPAGGRGRWTGGSGTSSSTGRVVKCAPS